MFGTAACPAPQLDRPPPGRLSREPACASIARAAASRTPGTPPVRIRPPHRPLPLQGMQPPAPSRPCGRTRPPSTRPHGPLQDPRPRRRRHRPHPEGTAHCRLRGNSNLTHLGGQARSKGSSVPNHKFVYRPASPRTKREPRPFPGVRRAQRAEVRPPESALRCRRRSSQSPPAAERPATGCSPPAPRTPTPAPTSPGGQARAARRRGAAAKREPPLRSGYSEA